MESTGAEPHKCRRFDSGMNVVLKKENMTVTSAQARGQWVRAIVPGFLVATPAIFFCVVAVRTSLNIPQLDDYHALLEFMNNLLKLPGLSSKLMYLVHAQHNDHKLVFEHAVVWLQYELFGQVNIRILCLTGDAFFLLLGLLLWKMFLPKRRDLASRLTLFIPVSWLLFQLEYHETLNWAESGLSNPTVIVFSFAAIYLLLQPSRRAFCGALLCYLAAVGSLTSGFLLVPIGLLILAINRQFARTAVWLTVAGASIAIYFTHYTAVVTAARYPSLFSRLLHLNPVYAICFMGNAANLPMPSLVLGGLLCLFFGWMVFRGYPHKNPLVSYCVLLLLLTSIGVAGIRTELGMEQFLTSRYTLFSALFLIFVWFVLVEEFLQHIPLPGLNTDLYVISTAIAMVFSIFMDGVGLTHLGMRHRVLIGGMSAYEHSVSSGSVIGPYIPEPDLTPLSPSFNEYARRILAESNKNGVYRPPAY